MPDGLESEARCVFCSIASGAEPSETIFRDEHAVAFLDRRPLFAGHTLVVPTRHVVTLADLDPDEVGPFFRRVRALSSLVPAALGAEGSFIANNNVVSQSVAHLHVHVVPRRRGDGLRGFFWPRQKYAAGEMSAVGTRLRAALEGISVE